MFSKLTAVVNLVGPLVYSRMGSDHRTHTSFSSRPEPSVYLSLLFIQKRDICMNRDSLHRTMFSDSNLDNHQIGIRLPITSGTYWTLSFPDKISFTNTIIPFVHTSCRERQIHPWPPVSRYIQEMIGGSPAAS